jgi:hypothetical protein
MPHLQVLPSPVELVKSSCIDRLNVRRAPHGDSSHHSRIEWRYPVEQGAQGRCQSGDAGHSSQQTNQGRTAYPAVKNVMFW